MTGDLLTTDEVAARFGVTTMTVMRWIKGGLLPGSLQLRGPGGQYVIPARALEGFARPKPGRRPKTK